MLQQLLDGVERAPASREHRVNENGLRLGEPGRRFEVVGVRLQRALVAEDPDMGNRRLGKEVEQAVGHRQGRTEHHGHHNRPARARSGAPVERGPHHGCGALDVPQGFVAEQRAERPHDASEFRRRRSFLPQLRDFPLHDRMVDPPELRFHRVGNVAEPPGREQVSGALQCHDASRSFSVPMNKQVTLYDTTLRDGTQGTGIAFSLLDKLRVAERLDAFGVDYIEGGFPGSNPRDVAFFREAAQREWKHARIAAFGSTRRGGVPVEEDKQVRLLLDAETPVVTIVGKTWSLHVRHVLRVDLEENLAMIRDTVRYLKAEGREVIYDAEHFFDSCREDEEYAMATIEAAHEAGAKLIVLCDTNGGSMADFVEARTAAAIARLGQPVGIHTHDDSGLGVANALAAIRAGASQVQGTINGYGERTGNCNLVTVIANLQLKMDLPVVEDLSQLRELSAFVDELANVPHDIRAPYVGQASFTHKGGLHIDAVQKLARSYEHIDPTLVGNRQTIVMSDMSGQSNVLQKAAEIGVKLEKGAPEAAAILAQVKELEDQGYEFEAAEASFALLVRRYVVGHRPLFDLKEFHSTFRRSGDGRVNTCEATVKLIVDGTPEYTVAEGDGPVNALDAALRKALRPFYPWVDEVSLSDYKVRIVNGRAGTAARTRVLIVSTDGTNSWGTVGVSENIIEASWKALVDSIEYHALVREGVATPAVSEAAVA